MERVEQTIPEPSVMETVRRAVSKAMDLRRRPADETVSGSIMGAMVGVGFFGPTGGLPGLIIGGLLAKVSVELAERAGRIGSNS